MGYKATIGLEIHAELKTESKMFCGCKNDPFIQEPNKHICPVCTGQPGAIPTANKQAIKNMIKIGLAVGGKLANYSEFDRKNYFYPDLPKGYQISQYKFPIVEGGQIAGIKLRRIHLEEDTAKLTHTDNGSLVDFNRSGVPLMELVTEPEIHDAKKALEFAKELQRILRKLNVSDADMEKGQMRIEANVSVSSTDKLGTKVELKNINSFKAVEKAIEYEVKRQIEVLESGGEVVQETRGWDEQKQITFSQRKKEQEQEYRYFPEPDLAKLFLEEVFNIEDIKNSLPELPYQIRERLSGLNLKKDYIEVFVENDLLLRIYDKVANNWSAEEKEVFANLLVNSFSNPKENEVEIYISNKEGIQKLIQAYIQNKITSNALVEILKKILENGEQSLDIESLIAENEVISDKSELENIVRNVIKENQKVVDEYLSGKEKAIMFLVGQVMKQTKGKANPQEVISAIEEQLST